MIHRTLFSNAEKSRQCEEKLFCMITSVKSRYQTKSALKKLRKAFLQQLEPTLPADPEAKRLAQRRVADYWRCIKFAMENEVPRHCFVSTNWKRIRDKMVNEESESSDESVSSSFEKPKPKRPLNGSERREGVCRSLLLTVLQTRRAINSKQSSFNLKRKKPPLTRCVSFRVCDSKGWLQRSGNCSATSRAVVL